MEHNMGVTSLSIAISNYLSSKEQLKVAYIELNNTKEIATIKRCHTKFKSQGIDFYPEVTLKQLADLYNKDYTTFVVDFGVLSNFTHSEFKRCDKQIALCSTSVWKSYTLEAFLNKLFENNTDPNKIILLGNPCSKKINIKNSNQRSLSYNVSQLPFIPNPFQITSNHLDFFGNLIRKELIYHART